MFSVAWHILYTFASPESFLEVQILPLRDLAAIAEECAQYFSYVAVASLLLVPPFELLLPPRYSILLKRRHRAVTSSEEERMKIFNSANVADVEI